MATYKSDIVTASAPAKWFTTDKSTFGTIVLADNTTLAQNDIIQICKIPANSQICDFIFILPVWGASLVVDLKDDLSSPNTYVHSATAGAAGGIISPGSASPDGLYVTGAALGYAYTTQQTLQFVVTTGGSATSGIQTAQFKVTFSPT